MKTIMIRHLVLTVSLVLGMTACRGFPFKGPAARSKIIDELNEVYPPENLKVLVAKYDRSISAGERKDLRNRILFQHMREIKDYHEAVETDLFETSAYVGFDLDLATLIATTVAAAVTPAGTKTWWAVAASITGGAKLAANTNFLDEKSRSLVLVTMESERDLAATKILDNMVKSDDEYSLHHGLLDAMDYLNSGSVAKSLASLSKTAMEKQQAASDKLQASVKTLKDDAANKKTEPDPHPKPKAKGAPTTPSIEALSGDSALPTDLTEEQLRRIEGEVTRIVQEADAAARTSGRPIPKDEDCVRECQRRYRDKVRLAESLFESKGSPHYHDNKWLNEALGAARSEFDSCLSTCK